MKVALTPFAFDTVRIHHRDVHELRAGDRGEEGVRRVKVALTPFAQFVGALLILGGSFAWAGNAAAFYDMARIEPATPVAGEPVFFSIRTGRCDILQSASAPPLSDAFREVVVTGNRIRMTGIGIQAFGDSFCIFPIATFRFTVGSFPPGEYVLEFYRRDIDVPSNVLLIATVPFRVDGAPAPVPLLSASATMALIIGILLVALRASRRLTTPWQ